MDNSAPLNKQQKKEIQQIIGTLLYYARAVDPTLSVTLSALAAEQSNGTEKTAKAVKKLLNYCATNPDAAIRYKPSEMILRLHSDASYLQNPKHEAELEAISTWATPSIICSMDPFSIQPESSR